MKLILTTAAIILAGLGFTPRANAQTLVDVDFSMGNLFGGGVTGELVGLNANGTLAPTDVILFTATEFIKETGQTRPFPETLPFDFSAYNSTSQSGEFTLVNGVVTAVDGSGFQISETTGTDQVTLLFGAGVSGVSPENATNSLTETNPGTSGFFDTNPYGYNGVVFSAGTPDVAAPEPSTYALALLGLGFLVMLKIRRQRAKA
jgi:hypothetical protein